MEETVSFDISTEGALRSHSSGGADGAKMRSLLSFISVGNPRVSRYDNLPGCKVVNEDERLHDDSGGVLTKVVPVVVRASVEKDADGITDNS